MRVLKTEAPYRWKPEEGFSQPAVLVNRLLLTNTDEPEREWRLVWIADDAEFESGDKKSQAAALGLPLERNDRHVQWLVEFRKDGACDALVVAYMARLLAAYPVIKVCDSPAAVEQVMVEWIDSIAEWNNTVKLSCERLGVPYGL